VSRIFHGPFRFCRFSPSCPRIDIHRPGAQALSREDHVSSSTYASLLSRLPVYFLRSINHDDLCLINLASIKAGPGARLLKPVQMKFFTAVVAVLSLASVTLAGGKDKQQQQAPATTTAAAPAPTGVQQQQQAPKPKKKWTWPSCGLGCKKDQQQCEFLACLTYLDPKTAKTPKKKTPKAPNPRIYSVYLYFSSHSTAADYYAKEG
jgi:hypothetical protein